MFPSSSRVQLPWKHGLLQSERPSSPLRSGIFFVFLRGAVPLAPAASARKVRHKSPCVMKMGTSKCDRSPVEHKARFGWLCRCACCVLLMKIALSKKFTHHAAHVCMVSSSFAARGCCVLGKQHRTGDARSKRLGYVRCLGIYAAFFIYGPAAGAATWTHAARQFLPEPPLLRTIKNKSYQRNIMALSHKDFNFSCDNMGCATAATGLGFASSQGETTEPFPYIRHNAPRPPGTQPA